jgi:hypothetical protein
MYLAALGMVWGGMLIATGSLYCIAIEIRAGGGRMGVFAGLALF